MNANNSWDKSSRLGGLRRFAIAITVFNILGHAYFGFEQSYAQPLVALGTAYAIEFLLEFLNARFEGRAPFYAGGFRNVIDFLLSAHITGLAVSMLIYTNDRLWPVMFGTAVAVCSKAVLRIPAGKGSRHFMNPSNFGITATLLLFPWVGISPPYHFSENLYSIGDWVLPAFIVVSGSFLNLRFTKRMPLIISWLVGFAAQAYVRHLVLDSSFTSALLPMTGVAFILYTFYMVTDPATTPGGLKGQIAFGAGTAAVYGLLMVSHIVFGLFFALTIVCAVRGVSVHLQALAARRAKAKVGSKSPVEVEATA